MNSSDDTELVGKTLKTVLEETPVYHDLLQPGVRQLGKSLETLAKGTQIVVSPIAAMVWGYETIREYLLVALSEKLKDRPRERLTPPSPSIAVPAIESLRYTAHEESLREMYLKLLATAIDSETASQAHPAFVEVIRQLTPDEARMLKSLHPQVPAPAITLRAVQKGDEVAKPYTDCIRNFTYLGNRQDAPGLVPAYIANLCRLGLAEVVNGQILNTALYEKLEDHPVIVSEIKQIEDGWQRDPTIVRQTVRTTEFGTLFFYACVADDDTPGMRPGT